MDHRGVVQAAVITPPRAVTQNTAPHGQAVVIQLVAGQTYLLNMRALVPQMGLNQDEQNGVYNPMGHETALGAGAPATGPGGAVGSCVTLQADGTDIGYIFGPTQAAVQAANKPQLNAAGGLDANGGYVGVEEACFRLFAGQSIRHKLQVGQDEFLGFVAVANGYLRLYVSSEASLRM